MFSGLYEYIFPTSKKESGKRFETNYIGINQGKDYLNTYNQNVRELSPNLTLIEKCNNNVSNCFSGSFNSQPKLVEGFSGMYGSSQANIKNEEDANAMTKLQDEFQHNLSDYANSQKLLMEKTANYINNTSTSATRNKNIFAILPETSNNANAKWEGCYAGGKGLIYQADLGNSATVSSCKTRASDLGYSFFGLSNKTSQGSKCSVGTSVAGDNKSGSDALKTMTSYSFKKNNGANIASLLKNGQIGLYKDNISNGLVTDLQGVSECDPEVGGLINTKNTVASYGANCNSIPPPAYALPYINN